MLPFEDYETLVNMEKYCYDVRPPASTPSPFAVQVDEEAVRIILGYQEEDEYEEKDDDLSEYSIDLVI